MPVGINDILHVLAHELRTPIGIANGYVRLLREGRLPQEGDRQRALEQMQKALGRLSDLSHETAALASWYDGDREGDQDNQYADARAVVDRVANASYESAVAFEASNVSATGSLRTPSAEMLGNALADVVRATARELRGQPCAVMARTVGDHFDMLVGPPDTLDALGAGPEASEAGPIALERGGLGLALVHAAIVLDAHRAERWTMRGARQTAAIRLRLEERPHP